MVQRRIAGDLLLTWVQFCSLGAIFHLFDGDLEDDPRVQALKSDYVCCQHFLTPHFMKQFQFLPSELNRKLCLLMS